MTRPKSPYRTRMGIVLASAAAAPALLDASPGPAHAADAELLLSSDGVNHAQSFTRPVFVPITGFVPGSSTTADIWIRNHAIDGAFLPVAALRDGTGRELAADLGLSVRSTLGSTARVPLNGAGSCSDLAVGWAIAPGESARFAFTLDLDPYASNATRRQSMVLEDEDGGTRRGACAAGGGTVTPGLTVADPLPPQAPGAPLAVTGAPDFLGWFLAAVAFLTAGTVILAYMQRKREGSDGQE